MTTTSQAYRNAANSPAGRHASDAAKEARNEALYDLTNDPAELRNLAYDPAQAGRKATLLARLRVLCDPGPPGFTW